MEKKGVALNSGIKLAIDDALEQYLRKGFIDIEQSLKSGVAGGMGGAVSSEMASQNNQNSFLSLLQNPKNVLLIEEFVKQNQNLDSQEKKNILDFLKGYRVALPS